MKNNRLLFYCIAAFFIGFSDDYNFVIYAVYFMFSGFDMINLIKSNSVKNTSLLNLTLYSLILPDNYTSIIVVGIILLVTSPKFKFKVKISSLLLGIYLLLITFMSVLHIYNIFFSILYWSLFVIAIWCGDGMVKRVSKTDLNITFRNIIVIQVVPIVVRAIFDNGFANADQDWVYGTMGFNNGAQMFLLTAIIGIYFMFCYFENKKLDDLFFSALAIGTGILTGSIALTLIFAVAVSLYIVFINRRILNKIMAVIFVVLTVAIMIISNHEWVKKDIISLANRSYLENRIGKIKLYENTFINIPHESAVTFLFGSGLGRYSSRAAFTMTGEYIDSLKKIDMSQYTRKYIYPVFITTKYNNLGSAYMPFSEICTIQGEIGFFGLLLCAWIFLNAFKESNQHQKGFLIIIALFLFYDNYLEYPRLAFIMVFIYKLLAQIKKMPAIKSCAIKEIG